MADHLGPFEQAALIAIFRLGEDAYGLAVLTDVQQRLGRPVAAGAIHTTLERLERKKLVASRLGSGTPVRGGRARRFYRLQPRGVEALNHARRTMERVWRGLQWPLKSTT